MRWRLVAVAVISIAMFGAQTVHASVIQLQPNNIGLVGYWSFNEGTSTIAHDYSGNGNTGTLSGSTLPQWVPGKVGEALSFDGSTNYISVASASSLNLTSTVTMSAWVYLTGQPATWAGVVAKDGCSGQSCYQIYLDQTTRAFSVRIGSNTNQSSYIVPIGSWVLLTFVYTSGFGGTYYVNNGVQIGSTGDFGAIPTSASPLYIGATNSTKEWTPAKIDEVRIYNRALSATQVAALYQAGYAKVNSSQSPGTLSSGLVGWWTMDGADTVWSSPTAGNEIDRSGNGNTGTLTNMNRATSPVVGKIGQALNFNGSSNYIQISNPTNYDFNNTTFTVSGWFKYNSASIGQFAIVAKGAAASATGGYAIFMNSQTAGTLRVFAKDNSGVGTQAADRTSSSNTLNDNNWHQFSVVITTNTSTGASKSLSGNMRLI